MSTILDNGRKIKNSSIFRVNLDKFLSKSKISTSSIFVETLEKETMEEFLKILLYYLIFPGFLFTAVVGLFSAWIDRKVSARVQWRIGPPWYQPFVDILKLLGKETIVPEGAKKNTFLLSPLIGLTGVTLASTILLVINFGMNRGFIGDLIVMIYLFAFTPLAIILGGSSSNNPFGSVGANREMTLYFSYELPFLIAIFSVVTKSGGTIKIWDLLNYQSSYGPFLYSFSGVIAFIISILCIQAKLAYAPFDIPEAETEVQAGPFIEYSGPPLAVFKLTKAMLLFVLPVFLITIYWGGLTSWWAILKYLAVLVLIILIKNVNPRVRIDQAMRFFWIPMSILAVIGMISAYYGY